MKQCITILFLCISTALLAQNGYEIKVTLKPFKNEYIYLGHHYGSKKYLADSVKLDAYSQGVFKGPKKLGGGIYFIVYPDRTQHFEVLIDKNQRFSVVSNTLNLRNNVYQNSPENSDFLRFQEFMDEKGGQINALYKQRQGSSEADSLRLTEEIKAINAAVRNYQNEIISKDPDGILAVLLKGMREPEVPQNHPDAQKDSLFAYRYFKNHYWDGVNFFDDRMVRTPFFEPRLDKYFEQLVYPNADSVKKEIDWMLGYASINEEMQKFLLLKFVDRYLNQQYMWEDAVFVHLFEKYFAQKNYPWLTEKGKKMITDRAYSLMANLTGNPAPEIELPDINGKTQTLYNVKAPFVLLAIWDPTCSHCKEVIPHLDSMYHAKWKAQGVRLFGMAKETEGKKENWLSFIKEHKLNDWVHVYYSKESEKARVDAGIPGYGQLFDVQSFPTLYLLDKDKRIVAKKVSEKQVDEIIQFRLKEGK